MKAAGLLLVLLLGMAAHADNVVVAVASNFSTVIQQLEPMFESSSHHRLTVVAGSTGKLYAQVIRGAPFDVFLAADQRRPELLEKEGFAVAGSRVTFAVGQLSLWSHDDRRVGTDGRETLRAGSFRRLAIANPDLAPYGAAAKETLESLGVYDQLAPRIIMGENISQTYAMVATGNADLGLIARSFVPNVSPEAGRWDVPGDLHTPIRQDAVLLVRAVDNQAARLFLAYLSGEAARGVIRRAGYELEP